MIDPVAERATVAPRRDVPLPALPGTVHEVTLSDDRKGSTEEVSMDERTAKRRASSPPPPACAAANIRRYLDAHRTDSREAAISVVAALVPAAAGRAHHEPASSALAGSAVRLAIERLRRRRASKLV